MKVDRMKRLLVTLIVVTTLLVLQLYRMLNQDEQSLIDVEKEMERSLEFIKNQSKVLLFSEQLKSFYHWASGAPSSDDDMCAFWHYHPDFLPSVSIVIVSQDSDSVKLAFSIRSIAWKTPLHLIREIVIVIDTVGGVEQNNRLKDYVAQEWRDLKVGPDKILKLIASDRPQSMAASWQQAVSITTGDVIVFLGSSYEVQRNWLPPLLALINENEYAVAMLQSIDHDRLEVINWNWGLFSQASLVDLKPDNAAEHIAYLKTLPYEYGLIDGVNLAISRNFVTILDGFAENYFPPNELDLHLSLRVLQCGGRIFKVPCSRFYLKKKVPKIQRFEEICDQIPIKSNFEPKCQLKVLAERLFERKVLHKFYAHHPTLRTWTRCNNNNLYLDQLSMPSAQCLRRSNGRLIDGSLLERRGDQHIRHGWLLPTIEMNPFATFVPSNLWFGELGIIEFGVCMFIDVELNQPQLPVESAYCHRSATLTPLRLLRGGELICEDYRIIAQHQHGQVYTLEAIKVDWSRPHQHDHWTYHQDSGQLVWRQQLCLTFELPSSLIKLTKCDQHNVSVHQKWTWITSPY